MNFAQIFSDKSLLDLALAASELPANSPERAALLARAGLGARAAEDFQRAVGILEALRQSAGCVDCDACVDENTLAEFVDGVLEAEEQSAVERQLAVCGSCLNNALTLAQLAHELVPGASLKEVVLGIARRGLHFVTAPLEGFSELALEAVPSLSTATTGSAARRWRVEENGIVATFTVTLEDGDLVAMSVGFEKDGQALRSGQVALRAEDLLLEVQPIGKQWEHHSFWHVEPGRYLVTVTLPDMTEAQFPVVVGSGNAG